MDNMSDLTRRRFSPLHPAAGALGIGTTRQSHDLTSVISQPNAPAGKSSLSGLWLTYPRRRSFARTKALLVGSLAVSAGLFFANALVGRPAASVSAPLTIDIEEIQRTAPNNLPIYEDRYTRYGLWDHLER